MFAETIVALLLGLLILEALLLPLSGIIKVIHKISPDKTYVIECKTVSVKKNWQLEKCTSEDDSETLRLSGFTILEFIVSTLITLIVIAFSTSSFSAVSFQAKKTELALAEIALGQRASAEIERIFRFSEQNPLGLPAIIHPKGQIRLADSSLNKVHLGNIKFQPAAESMAISNISLDFLSVLKVEKCSAVSRNYQGRACLKATGSLAEYKSYLLYSLDGYQEASGTISGSGKCRDFNVTAADGIYFRSINDLKKCSLIYIIPVKSIQSLYISSQGDLRLITHRTTENVENQPLSRTFPDINLKILPEGNFLSWSLSSRKKIIGAKNIATAFKSSAELSFFMNLL